MLGLSPDIIGNPWQKRWNHTLRKLNHNSDHPYNLRLTQCQLNLSNPEQRKMFQKKLFLSSKTIICGERAISRPLLKSLRLVRTLILEDIKFKNPRVGNIKGLKIHLKDELEPLIRNALIKIFKSNKLLSSLQITYERLDIKNKVPIPTFVLVKNLKKLTLDGQGEYLSTMGEQFDRLRNHVKIEEINILNKNFYFKHSFDQPKNLQKFTEILPTFQNLKVLNIDCYDQNALALSGQLLSGLIALLKNNHFLQFDLRFFIKGSIPQPESHHLFSKVNYLALCTNHMLSEKNHLDYTEKMEVQSLFKRRLMLNFPSSSEVGDLDWIKECTDLKALDIHFSNVSGEQKFREIFSYMSYLNSLSHLIVEFERTPDFLSTLLFDLSIGIKQSQGLDYVGLFMKNVSKTQDVFSNLANFPRKTSNFKRLSMSFCDTEQKDIDFDSLCLTVKNCSFLEGLKLEISLCNIQPNLKDLEKALSSLTKLKELNLAIQIRGNKDECKFSPPIEFMPDLEKLSIHQRVDQSKWMLCNLGHKLQQLDKLEEIDYFDSNNSVEFDSVSSYVDRLKIGVGVKSISLMIPLHSPDGNAKNKLSKHEVSYVRSRIGDYFNRHSDLKAMELFILDPYYKINPDKYKDHTVLQFKKSDIIDESLESKRMNKSNNSNAIALMQ